MDAQLDECRAELERLLRAPEFSSSRQLQDFLRYTSERAFEGASRVEQAELASAILGRREDFNPMEDASVRKLATAVRQRLDQYYSRTGGTGAVQMTLPMRSYLPRFEPRAADLQKPPRRRAWTVVAALSVLLLASGIATWWLYARPEVKASSGRFEMWTVRGDILNPGADVPASAVQLGPLLGEMDEITTELSFTPTHEAHQAGVLAWQDEDNFVRLGRRFFGRNQIDLTMELAGVPVSQAVYDPEGQSGRPIWLSLRRRGNEYRAFLSRDGIHWEGVGAPVSPATPFRSPHAAIYAFHGRRDASSARAVFSGLSTGVTFDGERETGSLNSGGWRFQERCDGRIGASLTPPILRLGPVGAGETAEPCGVEITRPIGGADWEIVTLMDFFGMPRVTAGLHVRGTKGAVQLARYFLNAPAVALIHDAKTLVGLPDLNGSPAILLRLKAEGGWLEGSYSADGQHFRKLETRVELNQLGSDLRAGLRYTVGSQMATAPTDARFYWYRQTVRRLSPIALRR